MNNGEFEHFCPVKKTENPEIIKKTKNIKMINIGQFLLIFFLLFVIFLQTIGILSNLPASNRDNTFNADQNPGNISYNTDQTPNISFPQSNIGDGQNNIENNINNIDNMDIDSNGIDINSEIMFILGENNGKLALFSPDGNIIYEIFDVYINTLPDFDRNLLINGIKIKTTDELHSLLEDYNS